MERERETERERERDRERERERKQTQSLDPGHLTFMLVSQICLCAREKEEMTLSHLDTFCYE
jgi:hypothetical protein